MKLTIYGTSGAQGLPGLFCECDTCRRARERGGRNRMTRTQAVLEDDTLPPLLLDFAPDTLYHTNFCGLPLNKIAHCLITHAHDDHLSVAELEVRCGKFSVMPEGIPTFHLYGSDKTGEKVAPVLTNGRLDFTEIAPYTPTEVAGWTVTALKAQHSVSLNSYNYLIEGGGKRILYATDTAYPTEDYFAYLTADPRPLDGITLDCAWTNIDKHAEHMNFADNLRFVETLANAGMVRVDTNLILTHFAHFGLIYDEIAEECRRIYAQTGVKLDAAYDGYFVII